MADTTPIQPGQPVPVVPTSSDQQYRRFLSFLVVLAGAALQTIASNAPAIQAQYPGVKWMGNALFLAGLVWTTWQRFEGVSQVTHVNLSQPSAPPTDTGDSSP